MLDIKDKLVWITVDNYFDVDVEDFKEIAKKFKDKGADSVLITPKGFDIKTLDDEKLKNLGLKKI